MNGVLLGLLVVSVAVFLRLAISLHPYSGAGKPPLYGDYEAQRHWMEITFNTPLSQWYHDTPGNNLLYWGLDYPPLTAYHSWLCGAVANRINSAWVALTTSRGHESSEHKLFMRYSVLMVDVLVFFSGVALFVRALFSLFLGQRKQKVDKESQSILNSKLALLILLQPGLLLIDYGHFQYNAASLGLVLWGIVGVITDHNLLGSIAFSLALNYKQMELYHALPFFFYLLGKSFQGQTKHEKERRSKTTISLRGVFNVLKIGFVVLLTFAVLWFPFFQARGIEGVLQVARRLFPFNRGLFEDKVANFWCSVSVLVKVRQKISQGTLVFVSGGLTLMAALPSSLYLLWYPRAYNFLLALVTSSLSFFLFSFQVHEKSILLACLPMSLLTAHHPFLATTFQLTAAFSMYPLLTQDQLCLAVWALCCLYSLLSVLFLDRTNTEMPLMESKVKVLVLFLLSTLLTLCTLSHLLRPPPSLPHIFPLLISVVSFIQFLGYLIYFSYLTLTGGHRGPPPLGVRGCKEYLYGNKTHTN
ncbi:dolichyl pyrophosphate Man9GlcNAc2 alpha-1,3-glucosyltransferase-like [Halichondria panicea]|uniref:dolichyl pyrophosphate Man9GlcNAc2 alpha-1,3-glucosyltransferase-like n=1 Tax=Halichondria panicea TaxID=6063 RepID=UPI00312B73F6